MTDTVCSICIYICCLLGWGWFVTQSNTKNWFTWFRVCQKSLSLLLLFLLWVAHFISFHFGIDISMNWRIAPALCVIEYHKAHSESLLNIGTLF